jgi:transcriptional regulator with XRE-family HTH domain
MTYFNIYIGNRFRALRLKRGTTANAMAKALGISVEQYQLSELGLRRFPVSEIFDAKKQLHMPIEDFFTHDGLYIPELNHDIIHSDITDLIHYYSNIEDNGKRCSIMQLIKDASSVF